MELNDTFFLLSVQANLDGQDVKVIVNGEDNDIRLKEICKRLEYETGKIRAHTILQYYSIQDGFLVDKEGNQISLKCERHPEIKFVKIKEPGMMLGDREVNLNYVRDTGRLLNLQNTEETITGLSKEEKKALKDEREVVVAELETKKKEEEAKQAEIDAKKAEEEAEEARKLAEEEETKKTEAAAKKAEEDAKQAEIDAQEAEKAAEQARKDEEEAKIKAEESEKKAKEAEEIKNSTKLLGQRDYDKSVARTEKRGMKVYTKGDYHFFYGTDLERRDPPFILVRRGKGKFEDLPCAIVDENFEDGVVEFEFDDEDKEMYLKLELEDEKLTIEPY